jgi:tight adherence protein B
MDNLTLIRIGLYIFAAVAAIFFAETVYLGVISPLRRKRSINKRLRSLEEGNPSEQVMIQLKAERGIFDQDLRIAGWLTRLVVQTGLRLTVGRFLLICVAIFAASMIVFRPLMAMPLGLSMLVALAISTLVPVQFLRIVKAQRQAKFAEQLPEALDVIVRSLRSGHPVPTAIGLVSREMADPIGSEFGITTDEVTYGLDIPRALANLGDRVGVKDLDLLTSAVAVQSGSGGNLSEVLDNLSKVIRDRFQLRRKVRAISAEGRWSAYGLTIMPILIFAAIYLQHPQYYTDAWVSPVFRITMFGLVVWSVIGDIIMFKMINFKF